MSYKELWTELKERLEKAELELLEITNNPKTATDEKQRVTHKLQGLRIAQEYMHEMKDLAE